MHRSILMALPILALGLLASPPSEAQRAGQRGLRYTIMVEEFENETSWEDRESLGHTWATEMTSALHDSGSFIVVGESDMREGAQAEQDLALRGVTTQGDKAPERHRMVPAQLLVKGVVTHFVADNAKDDGVVGTEDFRVKLGRSKTTIHVTIHLVDTTTGMVVATQSFTGEARQRNLRLGVNRGGRDANLGTEQDANVVAAIQSAIEDAIPWLVEQLPGLVWRGSVVSVEDGLIYVNRGTREGVADGDLFVVGPSKMIRDPGTGEILAHLIDEVVRVRADQVTERLSICSVVSGDPTLVFEHMGVQRASDL